jgi:hypothetical protein
VCFRSVHHRKQPLPLCACSIALVNAFGNLGGFAGTAALGALHDAAVSAGAHAAAAASPAAAATRSGAPASAGDIGDWGWGTALMGGVFLLATATTGLLLGRPTRRVVGFDKVAVRAGDE